jgi:hypothetical protein
MPQAGARHADADDNAPFSVLSDRFRRAFSKPTSAWAPGGIPRNARALSDRARVSDAAITRVAVGASGEEALACTRREGTEFRFLVFS